MNEVNLIGNFTKEFEYSHTTNNIAFYSSILSVQRMSSVCDEIPIITQYPVKDISNLKYYIHGEVRVFNKHGHSKYYVYPDFIYDVDEDYMNKVELDGHVWTVSEIRKTPLNSYIKDVLMCVGTHKIPIILWNTLANTKLKEGDEIHIRGRLQSRTYKKKDISRTILEVSANEII